MAAHGDRSVEILDLSPRHMFRHESEIRSQKKGGYLNGKILLPRGHKQLLIEISCAPVVPTDALGPRFPPFHPNMLHVSTLRRSRRKPALKRQSDEDPEI